MSFFVARHGAAAGAVVCRTQEVCFALVLTSLLAGSAAADEIDLVGDTRASFRNSGPATPPKQEEANRIATISVLRGQITPPTTRTQTKQLWGALRGVGRRGPNPKTAGDADRSGLVAWGRWVAPKPRIAALTSISVSWRASLGWLNEGTGPAARCYCARRAGAVAVAGWHPQRWSVQASCWRRVVNSASWLQPWAMLWRAWRHHWTRIHMEYNGLEGTRS